MKQITYTIVLITMMVIAASCGGKKIDRPAPALSQERAKQSRAQFDAPQVPSGGVAASGVAHYTCPNGHDGSASAGTCVVCGTQLQHNQAWHDQNPAAQPTESAPNTAAEPPQNAAGVWHYTCPNGHPGGAGSAVQCQTCGTTLVHNQAYHSS